ncbi:MAG: hypothetical protein ACE5KA_02720 [Nitrososphaerales archaeon]
MVSLDSFGAQEGHGKKVVKWMNDEATKNKREPGAKLYGHVIQTVRFGRFEMLSWSGELSVVRDLIIKVSKRYKIKTLEGGYKQKSFFSFSVGSRDYAKVYSSGNLVGFLELTKPRLPGTKWSVSGEKAS